MGCIDCRNGHCHSCHREIVGAEHHESDGVYCQPCAEYRSAVELLKRWEQAYGKCSSVSDDTRTFLASIGGEEK